MIDSRKIQEDFSRAIEHHQAGRLREAEEIYRRILAAQPAHVDALNNLAGIARHAGRSDIAADLLGKAAALRPDSPEIQIDLGSALADQRQLDDAIAAFGRAIELRPDYAEAHSNLATLLKEKGQIAQAIAAYRHALALKPGSAEIHFNLGVALAAQGQLDEAIDEYRQAIALRPSFPQAYNNLGNTLRDQRRFDEAAAAHRQAIGLQPGYAEAHNNLGNDLTDQGRLEEAAAAYRRAIELKPNYAEGFNNLGNTLVNQGHVEEAIRFYRQAIALNSGSANSLCNLGNALRTLGKTEEAIAVYRRAIALHPNNAEAHTFLSHALRDERLFDEAVAECREAIALKPDLAEAYSSLGVTYRLLGQINDSIKAYRQAIALDPQYNKAHSSLAFALYNLADEAAIVDEHRRWNLQHAQPLAKFIRPHVNSRESDRRLRVGYVSPDFNTHVVARFLLPLLEHRDRAKFEVFCYSSVLVPDEMTTRLRSLADQWRDICHLGDDQTAPQVADDGIDILVDLAGHTAGNRLLVFARKPSPVQISYLGYPGSTGLNTIDYRLSDHFADPGEVAPDVWRLPRTNWCFTAIADAPAVQPSPAIKRGFVTFGSFNTLSKITDQMLILWARIVRGVAGSRLMLKAPGLAAQSARERITSLFASEGIAADRLILRGLEPMHDRHLSLYNEMDIALDTFPYHGTTTTCDALWMGVPVIVLAGKTHVSRVGVSLLSNIGLTELIANSPGQYVEIAVRLASNPGLLESLRRGMRDRMMASPLMNATRFAQDVESAYRQMWRIWCTEQR